MLPQLCCSTKDFGTRSAQASWLISMTIFIIVCVLSAVWIQVGVLDVAWVRLHWVMWSSVLRNERLFGAVEIKVLWIKRLQCVVRLHWVGKLRMINVVHRVVGVLVLCGVRARMENVVNLRLCAIRMRLHCVVRMVLCALKVRVFYIISARLLNVVREETRRIEVTEGSIRILKDW